MVRTTKIRRKVVEEWGTKYTELALGTKQTPPKQIN